MDDNRYCKNIYRWSQKLSYSRSNWCSMIHMILDKYNLLFLWEDESKLYNLDGKKNNDAKTSEDHMRFWKSWISKHVFSHEEKLWKLEISRKSKLRTYQLLKSSLKLEPYLYTKGNYKGKMYMASLRSGTSCLEIERGRWINLPEHMRLCKVCILQKVENEVHFVCECPLYHEHRQILFDKIKSISKGKWIMHLLDVSTQFNVLMAGSKDNYEVQIFTAFQNYLICAFKIRQRILDCQ